jgi:hypothetical protein
MFIGHSLTKPSYNSIPWRLAMSLNLALFIVVVILVVGWFAAGTHYNVRKGEAALTWLQQGLPLVGGKTTLRWLGSSVVELKIPRAKAPFSEAEVLVVLEPRDVAPLWWIARLRGRRDLLVFRAALQQRPQIQIEAHDPQSWTLGAPGKPEGWESVTAPAPLVALAPRSQRAAANVLAAAMLEGCPLVRFTVHAIAPHLEAQWRFDQLRKHEAREVFEAMRGIGSLL